MHWFGVPFANAVCGQGIITNHPHQPDQDHQGSAHQECALKEIKQVEQCAPAVGNGDPDDNGQAHGEHCPFHHIKIHCIAQNQHQYGPQHRLAQTIDQPQVFDCRNRYAAEHDEIQDCRHAKHRRNHILPRIVFAEDRMVQLPYPVGKEEAGSGQARLRTGHGIERHDRADVRIVTVPTRICKTINQTADDDQDHHRLSFVCPVSMISPIAP